MISSFLFLGGEGFEVSKSGDARVGMVGFPSVGKSTLLTKVRSLILDFS